MPVAASASDGPLRPFKDELFSAQTLLSTGDGGASEVIDYQEMRDINGRDEVPERRVKRQYVDMTPKKAQGLETVSVEGRALEVGASGRQAVRHSPSSSSTGAVVTGGSA